MQKLSLLLLLSITIVLANGQTAINVISWNIESGGADMNVIASQMKANQNIDIWGLSEVPGQSVVNLLEAAAEDGENANFESFLSSTGGGDRLLIIYDADRFSLEEELELMNINIENSGRAPLVVKLRENQTGIEFYFMVNHLFRNKAYKRHSQSRLLNEWAERESLPIIATGDYNFDWEVVGGDQDHDMGYDLLTAGGIFNWVRPDLLIPTQCTATRNGDCRYKSVLDFIFTANTNNNWQSTSQIIETPGDFPDSDATSDHRQVLGKFTIQPEYDCNELKVVLLEKISLLEAQLSDLKALLNNVGPIIP